MAVKKEKILQFVIIALIVVLTGTALILASNADPVTAYSFFFKGIFGNVTSFAEVFVKATPLIFTVIISILSTSPFLTFWKLP